LLCRAIPRLDNLSMHCMYKDVHFS
jgi:hypothetical protein